MGAEAEAASATVGAAAGAGGHQEDSPAAAHRRAKGSSHRSRNRKVGSHSGESGEAEEDAKRGEAEAAEAAEEPHIMPSPPPSPPPVTSPPPSPPPVTSPQSEADRLRAELEQIRAQLHSMEAEGSSEAGSSLLGASAGLETASTSSSLDSLPHGSSSGSSLSAFDSSLFKFPPLGLHSLFDRTDDTQVDSKLHLGSGLGAGLGSSGLGGFSLGSSLTGGSGGSGLGSLLDSQLKSNVASETDGSTPTKGGAGGGGRKGGTPHWVEWLKTGTDVSINLAAWRPEAGVTIESLKAGKVPSSSLQTFKFEDDRGAAGGAAGEDAEREVQLEAEFLSALPETDWQPHFKTCAVVGNSGTLLGRGFGAQIDAHDAVMRINYAPTKGFENDVGRATTMDLCNKENTGFLTAGKHRWRNSTLLLFEAHSRIIRKNVYHKLLLSKPAEQKVVMLNPALVTMSRTIFNHIKSDLETDVRSALAGVETDPAKLRYAQELHKANLASTPAGSADAAKETFAFHGKPMSGITAAYTAMQLCESVDMYGFDAYTASTSTPYHYFDQRAAMTWVHSFDLAMEVYRRLGLHAPLTVHS